MTTLRATAVALCAAVCLLSGCGTQRPAPLSPDDTVRAAQLVLTDRCLLRQGLTPPRHDRSPPPAAERRRVVRALFGAGRPELRVRLPNGYVVRRHTDGCLAAAQQRLYGDQPRWFTVSTTVDNLKSRAPQGDRVAYEALRSLAVRNARDVLDSAFAKGTTS
ncbi:hypothetical protein [Streptomyces sp. N35]|uniref:hypothetical protein n=1 Tax=Streptomyces sp. N35 TaxID=2795730 RepID=UPI0018F5FAE4|nr:hypothetical protein [Streptomyces sp. N35]